jgi:hypothetical protein
MKPSAIRIERMLEKIEAALVPPPRKWLCIITDEGEDEAVTREKKEKALAEHVACHPEDVGRTVEDFNWIVWVIVRRPRFIVGTDGRVRWPAETIEEGEFEDPDKETDGPSETPGPIDLPRPDPGCLARPKPWRPVHQRPARDQRRPTWKKWER